MAQLVKFLFYMSENLNLNSSCNIGVHLKFHFWGGGDRRIPTVPWLTNIAESMNSRFSGKACLKK